MQRGGIEKLKPEYRLALARDGYAVVKCELAVFKPEAQKKKGNTNAIRCVLPECCHGFHATACIENSLPSAWFHPLLRWLWITRPRKEKAPALSMTGASSGAVQAGGVTVRPPSITPSPFLTTFARNSSIDPRNMLAPGGLGVSLRSHS